SCLSPAFPAEAYIFTHSPRTSFAAGFSTSLTWRTSGDPKRSRTIAFMSPFSSGFGSAVIAGSSIIFREYLFCRVEHLDQVAWVFFHHVLHLLLHCLRKACGVWDGFSGWY